jgi:predicted nucleotide-binding protein
MIKKRLLLYSSVSFHRKNFFPRLANEIIKEAEKNYYDVILKMASLPEDDYNAPEELYLWHELIINNSIDYDVICIITSDPRHTLNMVIELMKKTDKQVITIDVRFTQEKEFQKHGLSLPPILQVDNIKGGELAAEIFNEYFQLMVKNNPIILTIPGPQRLQHSNDRLDGFTIKMKQLLPKSNIIKLAHADWSRSKAETILLSFLGLNPETSLNGIFACNDEMALGARRALIKAEKNNLIKTNQIIKIVGFDNIYEFQQLIDLGDKYLLGTIDQNLGLMAKSLFDLIELNEKNEKMPFETLVEPKIIKTTNYEIDKTKVFIVHGHDNEAVRDLKDFLQNKLNFDEPIILHQKPSGGRTIIEKFEKYASTSNLIFILMTPDDLGMNKINASEKFRARQNVIFEMGYFIGKLGRNSGRVIILKKGDIEIPSDLQGIIYIDITNGIKQAGEDIRNELLDLGLI